MKKSKAFKTALISLGLATALTASGAVMLLGGNTSAAYASDRFVELDGNSVFYTSIRGAEINASEEIGEGEAAKRYTLFQIGEGQTVEYRQNLAYSWFEGGKVTLGDNEGKFDGSHKDKKFSMSVSFADLNFKRYIIKFQSQQNVMTKDEKTENYVIFTPAENGEKVAVAVAKALKEDDEGNLIETQPAGSYDKDAVITIAFGAYSSGNYDVVISGNNGGTHNISHVTFENVYEQYATYIASGDTAVTPLTFSAEFEEGDADKSAKMLLHDINGQSFQMHEQGGVYKVKDTASPVMCFTQTPSYLHYGKSISMQYRVIDVLAASPRTTAYYYVLSGDQYKSETFDYDKIYYDENKKDETEGDEGEDTKKEESPFIQISSSSSARIIRDENTFIPHDMLDSNVYGLVKLYFEISDVNGSSANKDVIFPYWYAKEDALVNIYDLKGGEENSGKQSYFLKLIDDKEGATYAQETDLAEEDAETAYRESVKEFEEAYQQKINDAIANLEDGKLYAGSDKFYLPAIDGFTFYDDYFNASDYKYSVYYRAKTTGSKTSLEFNKLAIDLPEADVSYRFTIFITDTFGNPMRYPVTVENEDGTTEIEWKEIKADDVWDDDFAGLLPFFEVDVSYKEATAEDPENLSLAYVGTSYNGVSFDIKGVSGTYTSEYKLYVFDRNAFFNDHKDVNLDYNEFNENISKLFNNTYMDGVNTRKYFTTVKAASQLLETDANYEEHKALNWSDSSVSFTPQSVDDFYVIELCLKDRRSQTQTINYATVAASVQTTALKGESDWAKNNMASIILLSIADVCLIALIVLLVVKPKDKGDIDAIYSEATEKQKSKKAKNSKENN